MVNIIIAGHGDFPVGLKNSTKMFFGETADIIITLCLNLSDNPESFKERLEKVINENYTEDGILIFVDLFAGTPCNMTAMTVAELSNKKLQAFTGANLPIVMEALSMAETSSLEDIMKHLNEVSADTMKDLRSFLGF